MDNMTITPASRFWPSGIRGLEELYIQGKFELFNTRCISVVGTRFPSQNAIELTRKAVDSLGKDNFTIVSGLARGIDGIAHMQALTKGYSTIGVIGTPIDQCYPKEHEDLQKRIGQTGLLVSQFPSGSKVEKYFFLKRNMTMAQLSSASLIIDDRDNGGAVAQAKYCEKLGKPVFIYREIYERQDITWPRLFKNPIVIMDAYEIKEKLDEFEKRNKAFEQPSLF